MLYITSSNGLSKILVRGILLCASLSPITWADDPIEEVIVIGNPIGSTISYSGINYDEQNPGDHLIGPSGENATGQAGTNENEALDACSAEQINLTHVACISNATIEHNGSSCGGSNIILGVEGTLDLGFVELDLSLSIDNNQTCDDDNMALNSAYDQCDLEKAQKEFDCAAQ